MRDFKSLSWLVFVLLNNKVNLNLRDLSRTLFNSLVFQNKQTQSNQRRKGVLNLKKSVSKWHKYCKSSLDFEIDLCIKDVLMNFMFSLFSLITSLHFAFGEVRSTHEKIFGSDFMSSKQEIQIEFDNKKQQVELFSPQGRQKLNTDEKRSIVLIETQEQLNDLPQALADKIKEHVKGAGLKAYFIFANFVHSDISAPEKNQFYIALIPRSVNVSKVYFQIEWFGNGVGAHNQIRMKLDQPIYLIPQESDVLPLFRLENGDLIYSLQAIRTETGSQNWEPFKGIMGEFANALQFFSASSKARKQIESSFVESYEILGLNTEKKKAIFLNALQTSNTEQETGIYNTVFNSCVTHALRALSAGIPSINTMHFNPYTVIEMIEKNTNGAYFRKSLSMNQEFAELASGPIMSLEKIAAQDSYQKFKRIENLVFRPEFDHFVQRLTLFIIEKKIKSTDVDRLVADLKNGTSLDDVKANPAAQSLVEFARIQWKELLSQEDIEDFLISLEALKSQEI